MTAKTEWSAPKRLTGAEVQQLVAEFVRSGMRRSEFCQSRGLSFSTLDRHRKKLDGVVDSLLAAQHVLEMFRRALPKGSSREFLDRLSNRLTKIPSEARNLPKP